MPVIQGACIDRKGKFYVVSLKMFREGGRKYAQIYGSYIREREALANCRRINRAGSCGVCKNNKDCKFAK